MVSLFHLADLHLDTPFRGLSQSDPGLAGRLRDATLAALDAAAEYALGERARGTLDAVTFGGDIFDAGSPSLRARRHFSHCLQRLCAGGLRCFIVTGNHDPYDDTDLWQRHVSLPEGATLFGAEWGVAPIEQGGHAECAVLGRSFYRRLDGQNPLEGFEAARARADAPITIGLLHGDVGSARSEPSGYAPVTLGALQQTGCDAWLLGHVHRPRVILEGRPWIGYPGNPQGRDINEEGPRGALHIRLRPGEPAKATPVPLGAIRWEQVSVPVAGCTNDVEVANAVLGVLEQRAAECEGLIARVTLSGRTGSPDLWRRLSMPAVLQEIAAGVQRTDGHPFLLIESIRPGIERPLLPREELLRLGYPIADFLRLVDEARRSPESEAAQAVSAALGLFDQAAAGKRFGGWEALGISLEEVLDAAEEIALGVLCGEGEMVPEKEDAP